MYASSLPWGFQRSLSGVVSSPATYQSIQVLSLSHSVIWLYSWFRENEAFHFCWQRESTYHITAPDQPAHDQLGNSGIRFRACLGCQRIAKSKKDVGVPKNGSAKSPLQWTLSIPLKALSLSELNVSDRLVYCSTDRT